MFAFACFLEIDVSDDIVVALLFFSCRCLFMRKVLGVCNTIYLQTLTYVFVNYTLTTIFYSVVAELLVLVGGDALTQSRVEKIVVVVVVVVVVVYSFI